MLKFLRKYSKWMMIVFGALLLVAFTAPQAIQQLGNRMVNREVATLDGSSLKVTDVQQAERQHALVQDRLPPQYMPAIERDEVGLHWYMLRREAEQAGLIGVAGDGALWVEDFAAQAAQQQLLRELSQSFGPSAQSILSQVWGSMPADERQQRIDLASAFLTRPPPNVSEREYHEALSVARGIHRLTAGYFESAPLSDARALRDAANRQRQASVEAFWFDSRKLVIDYPGIVGEPTEAQLQEHFERFASTPLGGGEQGGEFGIGYTLPERLKIEYLRLDREAIEANITPDPLEVRKRYQAMVREMEADGQEPDAFADARTDIEDAVRREIADEVIRAAQQAFVGAMGESTRSLESDGPYKRLPDDFDSQRPSFEAVAQQMVDSVGLSRFPEAEDGSVVLPMPEVVRPDSWLWPAEMMALEGFGRAQINIGSTRAPVAQVLFAVRELRPELGARLAIQKGLPVTDIPATDFAGNVYFYTVLDVRSESRPDSIDEIRGRVIEDWKALRLFERLQAQAEAIGQTAAEGGLTAAAIELAGTLAGDVEAPDLQTVRVTPMDVTTPMGFRQAPAVPSLNAEVFRDAVMGVYDSLDPLVDIEQTPRAARTVSVPIAATLTLGVGTVESITPLTTEMYRMQADFLDFMIRRDELVDTVRTVNPFSFDAMAQRLNLRVVGRESETPAQAVEDIGDEPGEQG
ncbi:MAG: hypothetical protein RIE77_08820 [Phycisphaerales bacterium]|jgi:hypothetical protein